MAASVLRLFFTDSAFTSSLKADVYASLAAAPFDTASNKLVANLLISLLSVGEDPPVATPQNLQSTLIQLQQRIGNPTSESDPASELHRLISMLQYFKCNQQLNFPSLAEIVSAACRVLFPVTLLSASSIQQLTTPTFTALTLELTEEYALLLLECLVQMKAETELIVEMALKVLGSHLHFRTAKVLFINAYSIILIARSHFSS